MKVTGIEWITEGYDIHMVPGGKITPSLLKIHHDPPNDPPNLPWTWASTGLANVTITFEPMIRDAGSGLVHKFGIELHTVTGTLEIDKPLPSLRLYNFIVEATVTDKNVTPNKIFKSAIRIHVHNRFLSAWLTPSRLSLHLGSNGLRFSVLANFEDIIRSGFFTTIGDITRYPGFKWESGTPAVKIDDKERGMLIPVTIANDIPITAELPPTLTLSHDPIKGKVNVLSSWSDLPATVKLVDRDPNTVTTEEINTFPNILFLPDGFKDEHPFNQTVLALVRSIKNSTIFPIGNLSQRNRLNYWSAFIPSDEEVSSQLSPMTPYFERTGVTNDSFTAVKPLSDPSKAWTLSEMMYVVGMPTPADKEDLDYLVKVSEWEELFGDDNSNFMIKAPIPLWRQWKRLGDYILANETNTALGITAGSRPNIDLNLRDPWYSLSWHPLRSNRQHINKFLEKLDSRWTTGKDKTLVIALCLESGASGTVTIAKDNYLVAISLLGRTGWHNIKKASLGFDLVSLRSLGQDTTIIMNPIVNTVVHELAHVYHLGDEYSELDFMPVTSENEIDSDGNLQSHSKLKNPNPEIGINGNAIKWRWPRITKAGVLIGTPIPIGAGFKIVLDRRFRPQNKIYFFNNKDKLVLLRQRSLLDAPKTSIEFQITSALYDRPGEIGDIIFIVPINPGNSSTFNPDDFRDGILFAPIPEQRDDPTDPPYKELVHKAIVKHINTHKGPLNAPRNNTTRDCLTSIQPKRPKGNSIQKPRNIPALSRPPSRNLPRIVGLYEGGHRYYCNLYHPSGYCIMRSSQDMSSFCHVCCYVLVDKLDPSLHSEVDKQYGSYYPKPR